MAVTDLSQCVEGSANYTFFQRTLSGHCVVEFDATGGDSERIWGKDPACCVTQAIFFLEYLNMYCGSGGIELNDGSAGTKMIFLGDNSLTRNITRDYRDDPLRCLTTCNTQSLCVSATNGFWGGCLVGYWGSEY